MWWKILCDGCELSEAFPILTETVAPGETFYPRLDFLAPADGVGIKMGRFRFETSAGFGFGEEFKGCYFYTGGIFYTSTKTHVPGEDGLSRRIVKMD